MAEHPRIRDGLLSLLLLWFLGTTACAEPPSLPWPQWRGPDGLGVSTEASLPARWSASSPNVRWRAELPGVGNSSPIVTGGRIFLTYAYAADASAGVGGDRWRAVLAIDVESGEIVWKTPVFVAPPETKHRLNTFAAPTPVSDGRHLWVYYGSMLAKLDTADGEIVWEKEIDPDYGEWAHYGVTTSPVLTGDSVIVFQDQEQARDDDISWLAAYSKRDAKERWRIEWDDTCCTYSTPIVVDRGAGEELVVARSGSVVGYDPTSGEKLWEHGYVINQLVSSPVIEGDLLIVSGGAHNVKGTYALRLEGTGKETEPKLLWENRRMVPQTSSPVLHDGLFYTVTDQGIVSCYRAETGERLWQKRLSRARNRASLVLGDGKLYVPSTSGTVSVLATGEELVLVAENDLGEPGSNASPAIADGCLLLRTKRHLVCIEGEQAAAAES